MSGYYIDIDGKNVFYKHSGDGPCLVFLHGIPTCSGLWEGVTACLEKSYSVYAFDLLGFGESQRCDSSDLDIRSQADFFIKVFKAIGLKEIILVGHDLGGGIAQIIAVKHSYMLRAMVLADSACYDSWPIELLSAESKVEMLFEHLPPDVTFGLFVKYIEEGLYNKAKAYDISRGYWRYIEGEDGAKSFLRAVKSFDNKYTVEISRMLGRIRLPVLILWGRHDSYIKPSYGYRLSEDIKNSSIEVIEDAGHFLPEDQPGKVAEAIDKFAKRI